MEDMDTSAETDCQPLKSGASSEAYNDQISMRLQIALRASEDAAKLVMSLIEGVSPMDPKYANICGSNKSPQILWETFFFGMYNTMTQEVFADTPKKRTSPSEASAAKSSKNFSRAPRMKKVHPEAEPTREPEALDKTSKKNLWSTKFDNQTHENP